MTSEQPEYRLSDAERQEALEALGEHLSTGRLDIDEYGDRTAQVTAAKFRRDLAPIFDDLPDPRPAVLRERLPTIPGGMTLEPIPQRELGERLATYLVPAVGVLAILLLIFVTRGWWPILVLPAVAALIYGATRGRRFN